MTPEQVAALGPAFAAYLRPFEDCFGQERTRQHLHAYCRGLLSDLAGERVVILSTHIVSDVEAVATEIAIIDRGLLVAHGAPEALLRTVEGRVWEWTVASSELAAARQRLVISGTARRGADVALRVVGEPAAMLSGVSGVSGGAGGALPPSLEDAYLYAIARARQDRRAA